MSTQPQVATFFDKETSTCSHIVVDAVSSACAIIDPVLDFDYAAGKVGYHSAGRLIHYIQENSLQLEKIIETHVHADHLSAAPYLQAELGGQICIGRHIATVQETFGKVFNEGTEFERDGSQFDVLFDDGDEYKIGNLHVRAMHTPGHTPACMTHIIESCAFIGDTLFMPDSGTARADFPGGDARALFDSIQKILSLPDDTRLYMCHDYQPNGRELQYVTTVIEERENNIHVGNHCTQEEFVAMRTRRDNTLGVPTLIMPSLQVNMRAGEFPAAQSNDTVYLRLPISGLKKSG